MPLQKSEVTSLVKAYSDMTKPLTEINNSLKSIDKSNEAILNEFKNGFRKEIIDHTTELIEKHQEHTVRIVETAVANSNRSMRNLYWRLAGTITFIAGLFALIVQLIVNLNK